MRAIRQLVLTLLGATPRRLGVAPKRVKTNWRIARMTCSRTTAAKFSVAAPNGFAEARFLLNFRKPFVALFLTLSVAT